MDLYIKPKSIQNLRTNDKMEYSLVDFAVDRWMKGKQEVVLFVNAFSGYPLIYVSEPGVNEEDFERLLQESVSSCMEYERVINDVSNIYLGLLKKPRISAMVDRNLFGIMEEWKKIIKEHFRQNDFEFGPLPYLSGIICGRFQVNELKMDNAEPVLRFYNRLKEIHKGPIHQVTATRITLKMMTSRNQIRRKIIVPYDLSFYQLTKVIQTSFGWHRLLPTMYFIDDSKTSELTVVTPFGFEGDEIDAEVYLHKFRYKNNGMKIVRGDVENAIIIEAFIDPIWTKLDVNHPICVEAQGVSGPDGQDIDFYEDYLADPEFMKKLNLKSQVKQWLLKQLKEREAESTLESINRNLERILQSFPDEMTLEVVLK